MSTISDSLLADPARAGVFQIDGDAGVAQSAAARAGVACFRIDIAHAHDRGDFLKLISAGLRFPDWFGGNWDALADCLQDLSWHDAAGWVVVLEKSKHFCAGHRAEFDLAMELMRETSDFWRAQGRPFWTLISGPEGWNSGYPVLPER